MTLRLREPGSTDSWLRRRNARWKLAGFFLTALAALLLTRPLPATTMAAGALLLAVAARVSLALLLRRVAPAVLILVCFFGWTVFVLGENESPVMLAGLELSPTKLPWLIALVTKVSALLILITTLLECTSLPELAHAASTLGVPGVLVQLFLLTQRYVHVIADEFARLRLAVRVRGFRSRMSRHSYRTIGHVAGTLLVRGHERADRVYHAMLCRGHGGNFHVLRRGQSRPADVILFLALAGGAIGLLLWDWRLA